VSSLSSASAALDSNAVAANAKKIRLIVPTLICGFRLSVGKKLRVFSIGPRSKRAERSLPYRRDAQTRYTQGKRTSNFNSALTWKGETIRENNF
jgi:hypothetical protein